MSVFVNGPVRLAFVVRDGGVAVDLSDPEVIEVEDKQVVIKLAKHKRIVRDAEFETDGANGRFFYETVSGDMDRPGVWQVQGRVTINGELRQSEIITVVVEAGL